MADKAPLRIEKFLDDGNYVIAIDSEGRRHRTRKGCCDWQLDDDPPQPVPPEPLSKREITALAARRLKVRAPPCWRS